MKTNLPITQREFDIPDGATLMSTTDPAGRITYANEAFVEASGFSREELLGQPHNIVRHPDMPAEAFRDMWDTLKQGQSWCAVVKNRRKSGDHYWVRANVTPMERNGRVVGYMSVRTKPGRDDIDSATRLYATLQKQAGKGGGPLRLHKGLLMASHPRSPRQWAKTLSVRQRLLAACLAGAALAVAGLLATLPADSSPWLPLGSLVLGLAATFGLVDRQVCAPLRLIAREAQSVASGQPARATAMNRCDDIGMLMRAINQSGLNLQSLLDDVAPRTHVLAQTSQQIAGSNVDLATRTDSQASALQETASAMEEISATVRQNADNAEHANQLAHKASAVAQQSEQAVGGVVSTMRDISDSAKRIVDIIGLIDGIAFRTNILALNAAVEAARAGEQGRGFAVVAGEVRNLAGRSAEAARDIKSLIGTSVDRIGRGSSQVGQAGSTMDDVVSTIDGMTQLMAEITLASSEQARGLVQVSEAIALLDQGTQENAAMVGEGASAASALNHHAQQLLNAVNAFRPAVLGSAREAVPSA